MEFYIERGTNQTRIHRIIQNDGNDKSREEAAAAIVYDSDLVGNGVMRLNWVGENWSHAEQARLASLGQ